LFLPLICNHLKGVRRQTMHDTKTFAAYGELSSWEIY
jgi:hypothetical protein